MGLEEAAMNQAPVGLENGADRAATSRENPVLSTLPIDPESYCVVLRRAKTGISAKRHDELVARNNQRRGRNYGTKNEIGSYDHWHSFGQWFVSILEKTCPREKNTLYKGSVVNVLSMTQRRRNLDEKRHHSQKRKCSCTDSL